MPDESVVVADRPELKRYEIAIGDQVAYLTYRKNDDHVLLSHTEVPASLRGRGLAGVLAKHGLDEARRAGKKVIVRCPFVTAWLLRHPEYNDIIVARVADSGAVDRQPPGEPR